MAAVKKGLGEVPSRIFLDIANATAKQDVEQSTDLIMVITGGEIGVRIRRRENWERNKMHLMWSVRAICRGHKTEIDKLREGFGRWYFMGWSENDKDSLIGWYLIDLNKVREIGILDRKWSIYPNGDGTSGMYIPITKLRDEGCILIDYSENHQSATNLQLFRP